MDAGRKFTYLSVCSGIEAATAAWHGLGWRPAAFSEVDPFARAVLTHHYPDVLLHGDFTELKPGDYGTIDLLAGGTPCQSFSIAGLRKGLADDRGNLALEFVRLAASAKPSWVVWENVPGVLSIDKGRAFGAFLGALAECGYGFAYRILDAQYFGVPQRRRRVFVVGYLGDWRPAAAVLFESESLCGDITPRREAGKSVAGTLKSCARSGSWNNSADYAAAGYMIAHTLPSEGHDASEDGTGRGVPLVTGTVSSKWAKGTGGPSGDECQNLVAAPCIAFSAKGHGMDAGANAPTLRAMGHNMSHANGGGQIAVAIPLQEVGKRTGISTENTRIGIGIGEDGDAMFTLQSKSQHGVAAFKPGQSAAARGIGYDADTAPSLEAGGGGNNKPAIMHGLAVRRLTPRECERLQGFPDNYTLVRYRGKPAADGPRYKALGNSMAVPVMRWIGERIQEVERLLT